QPNTEFDYDSEDMELDEKAGYTTDEESVTSEHKTLDPAHVDNVRSLEELSSEEDLDEWLKGEMEKHMSKQDEKNKEDALIAIIKFSREEYRAYHKNKQNNAPEADLKSVVAKMKVIKEEFEALSVEQQMDDIDNGNLDVYERKLCYDEYEKIYVEAVIFINERLYMEIKKQTEVYGLDAGMEYDPSNVDFSEWLASKFSNHKTMDWYTKNTLYIYWTRGDDEEMITDDELSNPEDGNLIEKTKDAEIFRIETDILV
ncbi:hypothetical protein Tco_1388735, partial [Tanacetum coccineum]